jgi:chaperonin cofactor prefoldin
MKKIFFIIIVLISVTVSAYGKPVEFTQEDRDRIIRLEEGQRNLENRIIRLETKVESLEKGIDNLKESMQKQIDNLMTLMLWGFGMLFGSMLALVGFVIWDRRTALEPAIKRNEKLEKVLKEIAQKDENVKEALEHAGLL